MKPEIEYLTIQQKIKEQLASLDIPDDLIDKMARRYIDVHKLPQIVIDLSNHRILLVSEGEPPLEFGYDPVDDEDYDHDMAKIIDDI